MILPMLHIILHLIIPSNSLSFNLYIPAYPFAVHVCVHIYFSTPTEMTSINGEQACQLVHNSIMYNSLYEEQCMLLIQYSPTCVLGH